MSVHGWRLPVHVYACVHVYVCAYACSPSEDARPLASNHFSTQLFACLAFGYLCTFVHG